ncbi:MAG TPA: TonB-dependent receptor [Myxococcota bacterium]|nr:TonB-dependent receptor [Myxococcota bacterium]
MKRGCSCFVCVLLCLALPATARGSEADQDELGLEDELAFLEDAGTIETAARHSQDIGMSPSAVTVITREDIEASGADNLADLLRLVPGMDVATTSPFFASVVSRLYMNTENQLYLVLIDGREANNEIMGVTHFEVQPIFLDDIERIEVIRGPGSALYGTGALAGVINVFTRAVPDKTSTRVHMAGGEPGAVSGGGRVATRIGPWGFSAGGGYDFCSGYADVHSKGKKVWKARALVERPLFGDDKIMLDANFSEGSGLTNSALGNLDYTIAMRSLRLAYQANKLRGHLYWNEAQVSGGVGRGLEMAGIELATFKHLSAIADTLDGEAQWTLPDLWEPLLLMVGGRVRTSWMRSDDFLDGETYSDPSSPRYHRMGIDAWELRAGAFLHAEFSPVDWLTVTAGSRLDYNTVTGVFVSPRLAAVFKPAEGHYLRLGAARSFRKPTFQEYGAHVAAEFPPSSPIQGADQTSFQEFMSRVLGNNELGNENLTSVEAGYHGEILDGRLSLEAEVYYNRHTNLIEFASHIIPTPQGLPDLNESTFNFAHVGRDLDIWGTELSVRYAPLKGLLLQASWSHHEVLHEDKNPKNLVGAGGRFKTAFGLLGSLYAFVRSEYWDRDVENPESILEPLGSRHMENSAVLLGRLGYRFTVGDFSDGGAQMEAGFKLYLPVSLSAPYFSYYPRGGGVTPDGDYYGGERMSRRLLAYLQGSF